MMYGLVIIEEIDLVIFMKNMTLKKIDNIGILVGKKWVLMMFQA